MRQPNETGSGMRRALLGSVALHAGIVALAVVGMPELFRPEPREDVPVVFEMVTVAEKAAAPVQSLRPPPRPLPKAEPVRTEAPEPQQAKVEPPKPEPPKPEPTFGCARNRRPLASHQAQSAEAYEGYTREVPASGAQAWPPPKPAAAKPEPPKPEPPKPEPPKPAKVEPPKPEPPKPAKVEPPKPEPPKPEPPKPEPPRPQVAAVEPARPQHKPKPKPEPPKPVKAEPAKPEPPKPEPPKPVKAEQPKPEPPKPQVAAKPEPKKEAKPEPKREAKPEPKPDPKATAKAEPKKEAKPAPEFDVNAILNNLRPTPTASRAEQRPAPAAQPRTQVAAAAPAAAPALARTLTSSEMDGVRQQIERCWSFVGGGKEVQNIVVEIRVQMNPDATVREARILDTGRGQSDPMFRSVAESARRAILNPECSPLRLPRDKYDLWKSFTFIFSPRDFGT
ncbi:hypothetical protein STAQ_44970 [Allostella sp. ATCC 35155]|nr:hypothetical protein STAQ_44970 [Stella sp. ATCC 35155]